jgi:hypothetical protein
MRFYKESTTNAVWRMQSENAGSSVTLEQVRISLEERMKIDYTACDILE